jgi:hypothetical protein
MTPTDIVALRVRRSDDGSCELVSAGLVGPALPAASAGFG